MGRKVVELGKNFPSAEDWDREVYLYCSKDMRSFNRIPEKGREYMRRFLGKVACKFICGKMFEVYQHHSDWVEIKACVPKDEFLEYLGTARGTERKCYGWHIASLTIYEEPKELGEFNHTCDTKKQITRPPQTWCYCEKRRQAK
jgi:predicted transcriptional regulator